MSKKDFELVASVMRVTCATKSQVIIMADTFAANYPRFKRERFILAAYGKLVL